MADKAYIVANEEQVKELRKHTDDPYDFDSQNYLYKFPYVLVDSADDGWISYISIAYAKQDFEDGLEIVYDGRKESKMKISKEVYDALVEWRDIQSIYASSGRVDEFIDGIDLQYIPDIVNSWWVTPEEPVATNNRLIAIIRWVNGENVFEVEKSKKWVVRSKNSDDRFDDYGYVSVNERNISYTTYYLNHATRFDNKEEAQSWANAHQEVVQVEVDE